MAKKRAEARARYYVREESKRLGWDTQHPSKRGQFLEEQETVDYFTELKDCLGLKKPDFLVVRDNLPHMVIETKSSFAQIDEAIADATGYANKISKRHDVRLAVGVAGTPDTAIQVRAVYKKRTWRPLESHGYQLTQIPTPDEAQTAIENDDGTTDVRLPDFKEFFEAAIAVSRFLRSAKIEEAIRPKVVGAIILALYKGDFSLAPDVVINHINANVAAAIRACKDVSAERRQFLIDTLHLSTEARAVPRYIHQIILQLERLNIRSIMRSGVDFIGQFYEAFLRYGADSKKLGIVFTPRHVTKYCADLVDTQLGHKVYDPACGTGGFLVAAFDNMLAQATTRRAIKHAKESLYGYDSNSTVWALAILNMIFRGDGKSNIELVNSCFDNDAVVDGRFDRALLNPPFSQENEPETKFIDHALRALKPGGECAAVLPTGVLAGDEYKAWRKQLVANHGVLAAIGMPVDLFYPVGAPTSLIVIRAHSPDTKQGTLLAKIHNDGFTISKKKRVPVPGSQFDEVLDLLRKFRRGEFKQTVPGLACAVERKQIVSGEEICAEQWLPQENTERKEVNDLIDHSFRQIYLSTVHYPSAVDVLYADFERELSAIENTTSRPTKGTKLVDVFEIQMGKSTGLSNYPAGTMPYISSGDTYNSIVGTIQPDPAEIIDTPVIPVTGFGQATIQPWRFCARGNGGSAVRILYPRFPMTLDELLWYACQINRQRWRFHYGRMAIITRLANLHVEPYPNWKFKVGKLSKCVCAFNQKLLALLPKGH